MSPPQTISPETQCADLGLVQLSLPRAKGGPVVLVIDEFSKLKFDINGDKRPDLSHGEVIGRMLKQRGIGVLGLEPKESQFGNLPSFISTLEQVDRCLTNGSLKISAINMSLAQSVSFNDLRLFSDIPEITATNVGSHVERIISAFDQLGDGTRLRILWPQSPLGCGTFNRLFRA